MVSPRAQATGARSEPVPAPVITCADNDQFVMLALRPGNVHAALGAGDDLAYLVSRLCRVWTDVVLYFCGDCDFGVSAMYDVCEKLRVGYTFGFALNAVLQGQTEDLLTDVVAAYERERRQGAGNRTRSGRRWSLGLLHRTTSARRPASRFWAGEPWPTCLTSSNDPQKRLRAARDAADLNYWVYEPLFWLPEKSPETGPGPSPATSLGRWFHWPKDPPHSAGPRPGQPAGWEGPGAGREAGAAGQTGAVFRPWDWGNWPWIYGSWRYSVL
jgi:hypothetical protein